MSSHKTPERVGQPITVTEATVQELQLELLRRTSFNALDGERIAKSLMRHRELWRSVMLDRMPHWSRDYTRLPGLWLIKMRDMPDLWNADTLFILTDSVEKARRLAEIAKADRWGRELAIHDDQDLVQRAVADWEQPCVLVTIWWD